MIGPKLRKILIKVALQIIGITLLLFVFLIISDFIGFKDSRKRKIDQMAEKSRNLEPKPLNEKMVEEINRVKAKTDLTANLFIVIGVGVIVLGYFIYKNKRK